MVHVRVVGVNGQDPPPVSLFFRGVFLPFDSLGYIQVGTPTWHFFCQIWRFTRLLGYFRFCPCTEILRTARSGAYGFRFFSQGQRPNQVQKKSQRCTCDPQLSKRTILGIKRLKRVLAAGWVHRKLANCANFRADQGGSENPPSISSFFHFFRHWKACLHTSFFHLTSTSLFLSLTFHCFLFPFHPV